MKAFDSLVVAETDARERLAGFGVTVESLLDVARRSMAAAASCTANHPPVTPGFYAWAETVCALREYLLPEGWSRVNEGNLPLVVNAAETIAITVATGDEETGRPEGNPCTKSKKGPRVASAVSANQMQLFPIHIEAPQCEVRGRATWLFLIHRDQSAQEMRAELSRPVNIGEDGRVDGWSERIILGSVPFDGDYHVARAPTGPSGPDIVVEIKKRA